MRKRTLATTCITFASIFTFLQPDAKAMCWDKGEGEGWAINAATGQILKYSTGTTTVCSGANLFGAFYGSAFSASYKINPKGGYQVTINGVTKPGTLGEISRGKPFCIKQQGSTLRYCWKDSTW